MTQHLSRNFVAGFLLILQVTFSLENKFELAGSATPITGKLGQAVVLPCQLKPNISAKAMEITWLTDDDKTTVFQYKAGLVQGVSEQYKDRTLLFLDELPSGNVSLLIMDLRVSDDNKYKCFVFEKDWFNDIVVQLAISNLGDRPQLSLANKDDGVTLKCESLGWYPKPVLQWRSIAGKSLAGHVEALESPNGLITMSSQIVIPDDNSGVICSIQDGQSRKIYKSQVYINEHFFKYVASSWKALGIMLIFFLLAALLLVAVFMFFFKKSKVKIESEKQRLESENDELRKEIKATGYILKSEWERMRKSCARVTLDPETAHPRLVVSADGRCVQNQHKDQNVPDTPLRFDTWHFVLGRESFTSGQHYWEVDVKKRADWYLGVISESAQRKGRVSLKPQSGYWIVRWYSDELTALTDPETTLRLRAISQKVGVYLDCDEGRLSFYSVEDRWHIYTFNGGVTGKLYPLFAPGCEGEELEILQPGDKTNNSDKHKEVV
ncbi:butyrophilin subfamily 1 member A1-like isoform X2 [Erpetoichthys calabaricus]|nr:butyrophilin subfamily 1 member A1-like isoform X2 [Erpetoichthys calabaricus]